MLLEYESTDVINPNIKITKIVDTRNSILSVVYNPKTEEGNIDIFVDCMYEDTIIRYVGVDREFLIKVIEFITIHDEPILTSIEEVAEEVKKNIHVF